MLADLHRLGVERILCLGDVVGYGADPERVVDLLVHRASVIVAGNHDHAAIGRADLRWFNPHARRAAEWTAGRLREDQVAYLAGWPLVVEHADATLVHASPQKPAEWSYLTTPADGAGVFGAFTTPLCFVGHSHVPAVWTLRAGGRMDFQRGGGRTTIATGGRYLVNVGSVGQPRDGNPHAAYATWDPHAGLVEIRRVPYDTREARRRIHAAGLPWVLGDRLLAGR